MRNFSKIIFIITCLCCFAFSHLNAGNVLRAIHENERTVPYPQMETPLYINPSALCVPEQMKGNRKLQFALSSDKKFPKEKTQISEPRSWCMFNPHRALEIGTWYWKFRTIDGEGRCSRWSDVYSFRVKEGTLRFVTPSFDVFFSNIPKEGSRIYCFLSDSLESARARVYKHPEFNDMISQARIGLAVNYSSDTDPYSKVSEMSENSIRLHTAYTLLQREVYAEKIAQYVRWLLAVDFDEKRLSNDFFAGDLATLLAIAYETCGHIFTIGEKEHIQSLVNTIFKYYRPIMFGHEENHVFNNHFWQFPVRKFMQAALVFYDKDTLAREIMEYLYEVWTSRAPATGYNRDGNWHNGTSYFSANAVTLYYMASLFSYLTGTDFLQHPWYKNSGIGMVYSWPPESLAAGFGDGHEKTNDQPLRVRSGYADFIARETGDAYAAWYSSINMLYTTDYEYRLYRMVSGKQRPTVIKAPVNASKAVWFKDSGEVIYIDSLADYKHGAYLSFRSSPFGSGSHTHSSQNAFNLHYNGVPVYRSNGYYLSFADRHNLTSYRHSRAYNTILVDGIGQGFTTRAYGNITRMMSGENIAYMLGDASNAYGGISEYPMWNKNFKNVGLSQTPENGFGSTPLTKYLRHILVLKPDIVVIYDEMEASKKVRWDWLLHSPVQFDIDSVASVLTTHNSEGKFTSKAYMTGSYHCFFTQTDKYVDEPNAKLAIRGENLCNYWHLQASFAPSKSNRVLTVIVIDENGEINRDVVNDGNGNVEVDGWKISAELNVRKPASITVTDKNGQSAFSYGNKNFIACGKTYKHKVKGSSLLYDKIGSEWKCEEMQNRPAMPTSVIYKD